MAGDASIDRLIGRDVAGRYRIVEKLGQGGMGTVFRADQISLKRAVALKVLDPAVFHDKEMVRRFHAEAELAARLSHPHTVTLYDFGEAEGGILYIAMELLEGRSLRQELALGPIAPARAVDIMQQVASSLADAHAHGIVHRDLKPDNVMLQERAGRKDFVRVLDFGIAKLRDEHNAGQSLMQQTAAGQLLGTPQYMAPEQILGEKIDGRADVYALGVVLYEMVTGRPPFEAPNMMALLAMHLHDLPPPPASKRPGLFMPPALTSLILRCLQKRREARPQTMQVIANELAGLAAVPAPAPTPRAVPMSMPIPQTAAPWTPPPMGQVQPRTPYPRAPYSRSPRSPSLLWLWITLAVLGVTGVAAVVVVAAKRKAAEGAGETAARVADLPAPSFATASPSFARATGKRYVAAELGFWVDPPPGIDLIESAPGNAMAGGLVAGNVTTMGVESVSVDTSLLTEAMLGEAAEAIPAHYAGKLVETRTRMIDGERHISVIFDSVSGYRGEAVIYTRPDLVLAVMIGFPPDAFESTKIVREQLFARGVGFTK